LTTPSRAPTARHRRNIALALAAWTATRIVRKRAFPLTVIAIALVWAALD
jgi:hypothetical protein